MATMEKSPIKPSPQNPSKPPSPSPSPNPNPNPPTSDPIEISTSEAPRVPPPEPPSSTVSEVITIPSYSRWFSLDEIHEVERRFLPEFFSLRSSSKNAGVYEYYRRTIVEMYRETSVKRKIAFTEARKVLVGDVGSIRRVFDFLEGWGLINYTPAVVKQPVVKPEEKENKVSSPNFECSKKTSTKKLCTGCRTLCSIACFVYDQVVEQADLTLCARCFVGGNYPKGINYSDFRRVEISEETKSGWNDKETLQLLEAITHYGDDWKKVAEHVGGRSEQECVTYFIKLPFGEQFVASQNPEVAHTNVEAVEDHMISSSPAKRRRLTPLADASNPIMAQAAFLSAMVGKEVARASAQAAVAALSEEYLTINQRKDEFVPDEIEQKESATATNGDYSLSILNLEEAAVDAQEHIKKEEQDMEKSISDIVEVEMKDLQDKIFHFEEVELQLENERQQLRHMKNLLFSDQLDLLIHRRTKPDGLKEKTMDVVS